MVKNIGSENQKVHFSSKNILSYVINSGFEMTIE